MLKDSNFSPIDKMEFVLCSANQSIIEFISYSHLAAYVYAAGTRHVKQMQTVDWKALGYYRSNSVSQNDRNTG